MKSGLARTAVIASLARTETLDIHGCFLHIGQLPAPRITQSGYFVDVYT